MSRARQVVRLAFADYCHERLLSVCSIFALAAALVPLLVLLGVKSGIVGTLTSRLLMDPRNLEVTPEGSGAYSISWLEQLRNNPHVAFVLPQTRALSASLDLFAKNSTRAVTVGLEPTAKGDPLVEKWLRVSEASDAVILSFSAAEKLRVAQPGQAVTARVSRKVEGKLEQESLELLVQGILPLEAVQKDVAFVPLSLLEAVEDYRDARSVPLFGWAGLEPPEPRTAYASFRLYATDLNSVALLREMFVKKGISVYTRAEEIVTVQRLDRAFTILSLLLFSVVGAGFFASATSSALAQVNRKRRSLGVLRVLGFSGKELALFPLVQSLASGLMGALAALALYGIAQWTINSVFQGQVLQDEAICRLPAEYACSVVALSCIFMAGGSLAAIRRVLSIDPAEVIRDV